MKIQIHIAALIAVCAASSGANADHKHGPRNECWRDSKYPGNGWAYYYCGAQAAKCDGKKSKGHDTVFWQYHGDSFSFETDDKETYWCCGGTKSAEGKYFRSDSWIVDTKTERMAIPGGSCNKKIHTNVCGETYTEECTEPDTCDPGLTLRNKVCTKPCTENQVFESALSNTCIDCETTGYQGPSLDRNSCIKCDKDTEFFNREQKKCMKKSTFSKYSQESMRECWRCPSDFYSDCVSELSKPTAQRGTAVKNWAEIKKRCHLDK